MKTLRWRCQPGLPRKHPHGPGEDAALLAACAVYPETPPRVWGRRRGEIRIAVVAGNTPTGVGKTPRPFTLAAARQKHPHGCGEDSVTVEPSVKVWETPPRVWGRRTGLSASNLPNRNTPTGVGKTIEKENAGRAQGKHPHGCGEDFRAGLLVPCEKETPPRVWGRRPRKNAFLNIAGNTPTGVGKTLGVFF